MKPKARLVDIDGTLCDVSSVRHHVVGKAKGEKDFDAFHNEAEFCPAHPMAVEYMRETVRLGMTNVIVTARMETHLDTTKRFVDRVALFEDGTPIPYDGPLHARAEGDFRSDVVVKLEMLRYLRRHYEVVGAVDDNPAIVELYTNAGLEVVVVPGFDMEAASAYQTHGKVKAPRL
jgi:phosphoglycolate phosphatase-like HAD superfamily hydrolase